MKDLKSLKSFKKLFEEQNFIDNSYIIVMKDDYDKEDVIDQLEIIGCEIVRNYPFSVIIVKYDGNKSDLYVDGVESVSFEKI
jgi:hypothetical protein